MYSAALFLGLALLGQNSPLPLLEITREGFLHRSRPAAATSWSTGLTTVAVGRGESLRTTTPGDPCPEEAVHHLDHGLGLVEHIEGRAEGTAQSWTLSTKPAGPAELPLELRLELRGNLHSIVHDDGLGLDLFDSNGTLRARYDGLAAWDATGRALRTRLVRGATRTAVRLLVADQDARYPITIDPVLTPATWEVSGSQSNEGLGYSVAGAGDVNGDGYADVLVGSLGEARLYPGSASGTGVTPSWTATGSAFAAFGSGVAGAGDVNGDGFADILIGASLYENGQLGEGAVYLYLGSANGPSLAPDWIFEGDQDDAEIGEALAGAGDVNGDGYADVILGSPFQDSAGTDNGRAYIFFGSSAGLSPTPNHVFTSGASGDLFGYSVSAAGDVNGDGFGDVLVGAPGVDGGLGEEGSVFCYFGSAAGLSATPAWSAIGPVAGAHFGSSVDTASDIDRDGFDDLIVGADGYSNGQPGEGAAFLFRGAASGPSPTADWQFESDRAAAGLGFRVRSALDLDGDGYGDLAISAPGYSDSPTSQGAVFIFRGSSAGLAPAAETILEGESASGLFGHALSAAGSTRGDGLSSVLIGDWAAGALGEGIVRLHAGRRTLLPETTDWSFAATGTNQQLGTNVHAAGDVDGDGYDDAIFGAWQHDTPGGRTGAAWLAYGSSTGLQPVIDPIAIGPSAFTFLGRDAAGLGDVNGDGYADVAVGAPRINGPGGSVEGNVQVFFGSATGVASLPDQVLAGGSPVARLGWSVDGGDFDGDGYADLLAGKMSVTNTESLEGGAVVHRGGPRGLETVPSWTFFSGQADARGGWRARCVGDVNGDGYSDLCVIASLFDNDLVDEGRVWLFLGSRTGPSPVPSWTFESDQAGAGLENVNCAGDVDGDGYSDVLLSSFAFDGPDVDSGIAWLFMGSASGLEAAPAMTLPGFTGSRFHGSGLGLAGDLDADGDDEWMIGSRDFANGSFREGAVFVYGGDPGGISLDWSLEPDEAFAYLGDSVAGVGDVDSDGLPDLLFGAPSLIVDGDTSAQGQIVGIRGGGGELGALRGLNQWRLRSDVPIVPLGRSDDFSSFRIVAEVDTSALQSSTLTAAAAQIWLEWEIKELGAPFDGTALQQSLPQTAPVLPAVLTFQETVRDLDHGAAYRWRARLRTSDPLLPTTRWQTPSGSNASNELHLRMRSRLSERNSVSSSPSFGPVTRVP